MTRLGVNIDHIATLRQARKEAFPDPVEAAQEAIAGGADGIVCHLREDRRHIQDQDVFRLRRLRTRLDLEMAATPAILEFALRVKPDMVTLVPEKRQEITTEGGLDIKLKIKNKKLKIKEFIKKLKKSGIVVSLFVDPEPEQIKASLKAGADFVEIHTGKYARASYIRGRSLSIRKELGKIKAVTKLAKGLGLRVNAGHGLDYNNVREIARIPGMEELNIGFSIIARSVLVGMKKATAEMRRAMR
jgi:pyridoxine 5-phosphate synthase